MHGNHSVYSATDSVKADEEAEAIMSKTLLSRLRTGEVVFGPFMKLASPQVVEIAGLAGFDFVICDTEHGPLSFESVIVCIGIDNVVA
ncbi:MAG: alpha-dehydro-beta-deoxy-D-glucarate aldolase [Firmicutes bacterium ADurb.BinA052]|nr:MAG: alpha-dehydro-beta-deoxy-D-glucarate aldolase [Firmicutes bacterium ADurb.BinA052]